MILACKGYARRDKAITLNDGGEAEGAWIALNDPALVDAEGQRLTREFNEERENIFRNWNERLVLTSKLCSTKASNGRARWLLSFATTTATMISCMES